LSGGAPVKQKEGKMEGVFNVPIKAYDYKGFVDRENSFRQQAEIQFRAREGFALLGALGNGEGRSFNLEADTKEDSSRVLTTLFTTFIEGMDGDMLKKCALETRIFTNPFRAAVDDKGVVCVQNYTSDSNTQIVLVGDSVRDAIQDLAMGVNDAAWMAYQLATAVRNELAAVRTELAAVRAAMNEPSLGAPVASASGPSPGLPPRNSLKTIGEEYDRAVREAESNLVYQMHNSYGMSLFGQGKDSAMNSVPEVCKGVRLTSNGAPLFVFGVRDVVKEDAATKDKKTVPMCFIQPPDVGASAIAGPVADPLAASASAPVVPVSGSAPVVPVSGSPPV